MCKENKIIIIIIYTIYSMYLFNAIRNSVVKVLFISISSNGSTNRQGK